MIRRALVAITLVVLPSMARGQATPVVPINAVVYHDIDRLASMGLIDTLLVGARPFTEREVVRALHEAERNLSRASSGGRWAERAIALDLARFDRTHNRVLDAATLEPVYLDAPYRGVPTNPSGSIDATINPLTANRDGRLTPDGGSVSIETVHSALLGSHLALMVNPRLVVWSPRHGGSTQSTVRIQSGAASVLFGNVSIEAGRSYAEYGPAPSGGLLLSDNAPAMDMLRVASDRPFTLPWWFRVVGPLRATAFVSDLGAHDDVYSHTKLIGYHLAALPHPRLELGLGVVDAMGGTGGQPASFGDRVLDVVPIFDVFRSHSDFQFSNKMVSADVHWRMPSWRGFELYGETAIDDFDARRLSSIFLQDGGYLVGTAFSCLADCGRMTVRAEYHQTGIRFYTHTDYPLADRGIVLGDQLGPRGLGAYLTVDGETMGGHRLGVRGAFEVRSGNVYSAVAASPNAGDFHFVRTEHHPAEKRARLLGDWTSSRGERLSTTVTAGFEHVTDFGFVGGSDRNNLLARATFVVRP
jgi:hypothetical protein